MPPFTCPLPPLHAPLHMPPFTCPPSYAPLHMPPPPPPSYAPLHMPPFTCSCMYFSPPHSAHSSAHQACHQSVNMFFLWGRTCLRFDGELDGRLMRWLGRARGHAGAQSVTRARLFCVIPVNFENRHGTAVRDLVHGQLSHRWLHVNMAYCLCRDQH